MLDATPDRLRADLTFAHFVAGVDDDTEEAVQDST
jgi:hypothetical protein